jgi:hypothetical protein
MDTLDLERYQVGYLKSWGWVIKRKDALHWV